MPPVLATGSRLGPYEIVAPLGAGGMGEVYRARDSRLGRDVALKVLPEELAADPERLRRFELEARAASALSHPNVVAIHDVGREGNVSYVVMELVEGKSLREAMHGGPLPPKRLLALAAKIAEGLAAAHARGIVHRDLKPENVMVGGDGLVKILDFGLAKLAPLAASEGDRTATFGGAATGSGVILGTVGYMSPEQASGGAVDFRSDQFALGTILYEMAAGRRAFTGATPVDTLSAILHAEPEPLAVAGPLAPVPLRWTIERCLSKDPEGRFASTRDLAAELRTIRDHLSDAASGAPAAARAPRSRRWTPAALLLGAVAAALVVAYFAGRRAGAPVPLAFQRLTLRRGLIFTARLTPDERSVVYGGAWDGRSFEVFSTPIAAPASNALGFADADVLAVSRSGELALSLHRQHNRTPYASLGTLGRAPMSGGTPRELLAAVLHADWSPDGSELAVARTTGEVMRLEYPVGTLLAQNDWLGYPRVSPDGARVAFYESKTGGGGELSVVDVKSRKTTLVRGLDGERSGLAWARDGRSIWFAHSEVGKNLTLERVTLSGKRTLVTTFPAAGFLHDVTSDGRVLVTLGDLRFGIVWQRPHMPETDASWLETSAARGISADGSTILFWENSSLGGAVPGVYLRRADLSPAVKLGDGIAIDLTSDGKWALARARGKVTELLAMPAGIGEPRRFSTSGLGYGTAAWLDDGTRVVFSAVDGGKTSLYVQALDGPPRVFATDVGGGTFCPGADRRSAVFIGSDGKARLFPVDGGQPRELLGIVAGDRPIVSARDGRTLYVSRSRGFPYRVESVDTVTGARSLWKEIVPADVAGIGYLGFGMTPDGQSWAYSYARHLATLYLVEGLR
jgi:Tol biopolymer transport system component